MRLLFCVFPLDVEVLFISQDAVSLSVMAWIAVVHFLLCAVELLESSPLAIVGHLLMVVVLDFCQKSYLMAC